MHVPVSLYPWCMAIGTQLADVVMLVGTVDVVFGSVDLYITSTLYHYLA